MSTIAVRGTSTVDENVADDALLTPAEVASLFRVSPKTVTRWARSGKLTAMKTLGGHRRFRAGEVRTALASAGEQVEGQ
jgi:excisionase family DNA binding protein